MRISSPSWKSAFLVEVNGEHPYSTWHEKCQIWRFFFIPTHHKSVNPWQEKIRVNTLIFVILPLKIIHNICYFECTVLPYIHHLKAGMKNLLILFLLISYIIIRRFWFGSKFFLYICSYDTVNRYILNKFSKGISSCQNDNFRC